MAQHNVLELSHRLGLKALASTVVALGGGAQPLIVGANNNALTSSSNYNVDHDSHHCRKNFSGGGIGGSHAWCAAHNDPHQWIQYTHPTQVLFYAFGLQGRGADCPDQRVTRCSISISLDGIVFIPVPGSFDGPSNSYEEILHKFDVPFVARAIRLHPLEWTTHVSLRWEAYTLA